MGMFGHFRLSLRLRLERNTLGKGVSYISCVCKCCGVRARNVYEMRGN